MPTNPVAEVAGCVDDSCMYLRHSTVCKRGKTHTYWRLVRSVRKGAKVVPWATMAAILVLARLAEPSSELHIAEDWYRGTALDDLLGVAPESCAASRKSSQTSASGRPCARG